MAKIVLFGWQMKPLIYRLDGTVGKEAGFDSTLKGEELLVGFEFNLSLPG